MKILYIVTQPDAGGAQRYAFELARTFNGTIYSGGNKGYLFDAGKASGVPVHSLKFLKRQISPYHDIRAFFDIYSVVKKERPDIVHVNSSKAGIIGSIAAKIAGAKVIFTAHGFVFLEPLPYPIKLLYIWAEKFASFFRDQIISVSEHDRKAAINAHVCAQDKILTIHNGIQKIDFLSKHDAREFLKLPQDEYVIGCIANDYYVKGLDVLLKAFEKFKVTQRPYLCIIGETEKKPEDDHVILSGQIQNASRFLKAFDLFVLPSRKEGFPLAILEAMQAGLPIVATNVGGVAEGLSDCGVLVPPDNPKALMEAMKSLNKNEVRKAELRDKGIDRSAVFTLSTMIEKTRLVYQKILS